MQRLREWLFYLLRFSLLYICLWAVLHMTFAVVNHALPPVGMSPDWRGFQTLRDVLVITLGLPSYVMILSRNGRYLKEDLTRYASPARKSFIYLTLGLCVSTLALCSMTLLESIRYGSLDLNVGCKLGALVFLSVVLFLDYRAALNAPASKTPLKGALLWLVLALVGGTYVTGIVFAIASKGAPS